MSARPNVVFLCTDEMRASAMGRHGNPHRPTPFLDALAARGACFDRCHCVHPKCTPSRVSVLTAQYPHVGGHRTLEMPARPHEPNLVRALRDSGYETCLVGRNHVTDDVATPQTFDHWLRADGTMKLDADDPVCDVAGSYLLGRDDRPLGATSDHARTERARRWLREERDAGRPFFLWLNLEFPHPPYAVTAPYYGRIDRSAVDLPPRADGVAGEPPPFRVLREAYGLGAMTDADWREMVAVYHEMCMACDDRARDLMNTLGDLGLADNTLFVHWADHGDFAGHYGLPEKWDTCFHDCITRVPLSITGPGVMPLRSDALVELIDVMPTLLDLCGVPVPPGVQGRSLAPLMRGETTAHRDLVFCQGGQEPALLARTVPHRDRPRPAAAYYLKQLALERDPWINVRAKMIFDGRWRYVYRFPRPGELRGFEELYDVDADPHELQNLAGDESRGEVLDRMRTLLVNKLIEAETVEPFQEFLEA